MRMLWQEHRVMTLTIEGEEVDRLAEALAALKRVGKMEAVKRESAFDRTPGRQGIL